MKEKNVKINIIINLISIIIVLIYVIGLIVFEAPIIKQIHYSAILICVEIILNRMVRIIKIKQNTKKRNIIIVTMAILIFAYISYSIMTMLAYEIIETLIGFCTASVIVIITIISELIRQLETIKEKVSIADVILLIVCILIPIFSSYIVHNYDSNYDYNSKAAKTPEELHPNNLAPRTFNSMFTPYEGENQSVSQIKALVSVVEAGNMNDKEHQVEIEPADIDKKLQSGKRYSVILEYGEDKYINKIIITEEENEV